MSGRPPNLDPMSWQRSLGANRHLEKTLRSGGIEASQEGITPAERRRFQLIELLKMLAFGVGLVVLTLGLLYIVGLITGR